MGRVFVVFFIVFAWFIFTFLSARQALLWGEGGSVLCLDRVLHGDAYVRFHRWHHCHDCWTFYPFSFQQSTGVSFVYLHVPILLYMHIHSIETHLHFKVKSGCVELTEILFQIHWAVSVYLHITALLVVACNSDSRKAYKKWEELQRI